MTEASYLERVRYWQGQLLSAGDLQAQMRSVAELRRLHNRAVHSAYGIAIGLAVGDIKDGAVPVSCGLAYDCSGRELIIPVDRTVALPKPPITAATLLVISYDAALGSASLSWRPQGQPVATDDVAIARIVPGTPPTLDQTFLPVIARPLARARIASGQTVPGETPWELWHEGSIEVGLQTTVDTTTAGFTTPPNYFAEVTADNMAKDFVLAWFTSIDCATASSFTVRLLTRGITRETFVIVEPRVQVAATPAVGGPLTVATANVFGMFDLISRLLPIAQSGSMITALSGGTAATIDTPLPNFNAARLFAFGNRPRVATVTDGDTPSTTTIITVDTPENFQQGNVIARMGPHFASSHPTTVVSIDDGGKLELNQALSNLAVGDSLGVAEDGSKVTNVTATTVNVEHPQQFNLNDIIVCVDAPVENFASSQITAIDANTNAFTLTPFIGGLMGKSIAPVRNAGSVLSLDTGGSEVKIHVNSVNAAKQYRAGDLVAKLLTGGAVSGVVRIQTVQSNSQTITLSSSIGLSNGDQIASADFRVRATVLSVSGSTITLANSSLFSKNSIVARLDDNYTPTGHATVTGVLSPTQLTLGSGIDQLKPGDILALCGFPTSVLVNNVASDGTITVTPGDAINTGDVVVAQARAGIAIVSSASGGALQLATPISGLTAGDTLTVVTVGGAVEVTPGASNTQVTLDADNRLRVGDFLADIVSWREAGPVRNTAYVMQTSGTSISLMKALDGLMKHDTVGFASVTDTDFALEIRVDKMPSVNPGDDVLLAGLDRLQGKTKSLRAKVAFLLSSLKLILLQVSGNTEPFTIRPSDLSASALLASAASLLNQNLYVNWIAVQDPVPMPRPCPEDNQPDCPCGKANQS
jgi:hypothetical protein